MTEKMKDALIKYDCGCETYGVINLNDWDEAIKSGKATFRSPTEIEDMACGPDVVILDHCYCHKCNITRTKGESSR